MDLFCPHNFTNMTVPLHKYWIVWISIETTGLTHKHSPNNFLEQLQMSVIYHTYCFWKWISVIPSLCFSQFYHMQFNISFRRYHPNAGRKKADRLKWSFIAETLKKMRIYLQAILEPRGKMQLLKKWYMTWANEQNPICVFSWHKTWQLSVFQIHWFATNEHRNPPQEPGRYVTVFLSQTDCSIWMRGTKLSPSTRHTIHLEFRTAIIPFLVQGSCHSDLALGYMECKGKHQTTRQYLTCCAFPYFSLRKLHAWYFLSPNSSFLPLLSCQ